MILVDVKEGIDVELKGEVMDQLLEFVMITKSLRQSLPEKVKEKLPKAFEVAMTVDDDCFPEGAKEELRPIFEISITEDSEEQVVEKVGKRLYEKICKRQ